MPAPMTEDELVALYRDLHAHPELAFAETRTAGIVAQRLGELGYAVHVGIGGTGVVGVLDNGSGPIVLLRADMDALPVAEQTGLGYASTVPDVMHACGHDVHVTCLLGAASELAADLTTWNGRVVLVFQPAEERGAGARAMVEDGLFDLVGRPVVVLGQHVAPAPAGMLGLHAGVAMATSDTFSVTMHGAGGHGSRPEATVDPIVMAAATILRLQTIASRETAGAETVVLTVGTIQAGSAANVIPDRAQFGVNIRTVEEKVRERVLSSLHRIVEAEAQASGAPRAPEIEHTDHFPVLVNDPDATERTRVALQEAIGFVIDPGVVTGSEDVGVLATEAGVPCVFWFLGGADPAAFAAATDMEDINEVLRALPSNHSPEYAPLPSPTLSIGVRALVAAAISWARSA